MSKKIKELIKILDNENSTAAEVKKARHFLIAAGVMRINKKKYELAAQYDSFLYETGIKSSDQWIFYGFVTKWD